MREQQRALLGLEKTLRFIENINAFICHQRGIKVKEVQKEMHTSRSWANECLRGGGSEKKRMDLDEAITAISDRRGGPFQMTGAGPEAVSGFQEVMRDGYLRANGWGMESLAGRVRRGTVT